MILAAQYVSHCFCDGSISIYVYRNSEQEYHPICCDYNISDNPSDNQNHNRYWLILLYTEFGYDVKGKVGCDVVISYRNLWNVMKDKGISQYALIKQYHVSPAQITRLKRNESVSTHTIEMFCKILDCQVGDIMEYIPDDDQRCDYSRD